MNQRIFVLLLGLGIVTGCAAPTTRTASKPEFLNTPQALERGFPFSEAVRAGDLLFLAGQLGSDPATGRLVAGGIGPEARQTLENIRAVLERNHSSLADVVKCTVFLADIAEWGAFNEVYKEFFRQPYPARSALGTNGLALGARAEVECIAYVAAAPR